MPSVPGQQPGDGGLFDNIAVAKAPAKLVDQAAGEGGARGIGGKFGAGNLLAIS